VTFKRHQRNKTLECFSSTQTCLSRNVHRSDRNRYEITEAEDN